MVAPQRIASAECICRSVAIAGTSLTAWVVETFSTIDEHGPPIGGADR
jgi:hypothetical protein